MDKSVTIYNALNEFVKILLKYMKKFGLETVDIAFLSSTNRTNIDNLVNLKGSLELPRMEAIAQSFNLHHYQFSNPTQAIPTYSSLPERTQKRIEYRKKKGPYVPEPKNSLTINDKITIVLSFYNKNDEFLTENIVEKINTVDADSTSDTTIIGDRLAKSFSKYVKKTDKPFNEKSGRGPKPFFYEILSAIDTDDLKNAINVLGDYWFDNCNKLFSQEREIENNGN